MYFDGAVNSTGYGIGAILISPKGKHYPIVVKVTFHYTNNIAEYKGYILGLKAALEFKVRGLEVYGDSMLIIFQTTGNGKPEIPNWYRTTSIRESVGAI